ncbi:hypothetical protein [Microcoleus sp.]|uniref:hypothetical protein n=1 Tax=Microcoleus sp. TaxID=44472 RepID=UPI0035932589
MSAPQELLEMSIRIYDEFIILDLYLARLLLNTISSITKSPVTLLLDLRDRALTERQKIFVNTEDLRLNLPDPG